MYISPSIVVGFHGCDQAVFDKVIKQGEHLSNSENDYDWLGHGIYFWEGSYERAMEWARHSPQISNPAVVGAFIQLGNCIDLLDSEHIKKIHSAYQLLQEECERLGTPFPENKFNRNGISMVRELDCKVIQQLHQTNNECIAEILGLELVDEALSDEDRIRIQQHPLFIDSVRGMFPEGVELYKDAGFRAQNHIQLCIVNPNCIIGYFHPLQSNPLFKQV